MRSKRDTGRKSSVDISEIKGHLGPSRPRDFLEFCSGNSNRWSQAHASVAELVDALDLGSSGEIRGGSIPSTRTNFEISFHEFRFNDSVSQ